MPAATLTVGEARRHLIACMNGAEALRTSLSGLNQRGRVTAFGPNPVPVPFAKCATIARDHVIVDDYVQGLDGIIGWLGDLIDGLPESDDRAFCEEPLA